MKRRVRHVVDALVAGAFVYGAMAACNSTSESGSPGGAAATGGGGAGGTGHAHTTATTSTAAHGGGGRGSATGSGGDGANGATGGQGGSATGGRGGASTAASGAAGQGGVGGSTGSAQSVTTGAGGAVASGTGGAPATSSGAGAGGAGPTTRLKQKYVAGADGSRFYDPVVRYDSLRAEDCAYITAGDRTVRCLPIDVSQEPVFFKDAACTQPFIYVVAPPVGCAATAPKYAQTYEPSPVCPVASQPAAIHLYPILGRIADPPQKYNNLNGVPCHLDTGSGGTRVAFDLGPEAVPASFVAGAAANDP